MQCLFQSYDPHIEENLESNDLLSRSMPGGICAAHFWPEAWHDREACYNREACYDREVCYDRDLYDKYDARIRRARKKVSGRRAIACMIKVQYCSVFGPKTLLTAGVL